MVEMIINVLSENLLDVVISVISIVVSYYVIPAIKNDLIPWLKEKRMYDIVKKLVHAAEKMAKSGAIEKCDKKEEVVRLLRNKGIIVTEEIDTLIESAVEELDLIASTIHKEIVKK